MTDWAEFDYPFQSPGFQGAGFEGHDHGPLASSGDNTEDSGRRDASIQDYWDQEAVNTSVEEEYVDDAVAALLSHIQTATPSTQSADPPPSPNASGVAASLMAELQTVLSSHEAHSSRVADPSIIVTSQSVPPQVGESTRSADHTIGNRDHGGIILDPAAAQNLAPDSQSSQEVVEETPPDSGPAGRGPHASTPIIPAPDRSVGSSSESDSQVVEKLALRVFDIASQENITYHDLINAMVGILDVCYSPNVTAGSAVANRALWDLLANGEDFFGFRPQTGTYHRRTMDRSDCPSRPLGLQFRLHLIYTRLECFASGSISRNPIAAGRHPRAFADELINADNILYLLFSALKRDDDVISLRFNTDVIVNEYKKRSKILHDAHEFGSKFQTMIRIHDASDREITKILISLDQLDHVHENITFYRRRECLEVTFQALLHVEPADIRKILCDHDPNENYGVGLPVKLLATGPTAVAFTVLRSRNAISEFKALLPYSEGERPRILWDLIYGNFSEAIAERFKDPKEQPLMLATLGKLEEELASTWKLTIGGHSSVAASNRSKIAWHRLLPMGLKIPSDVQTRMRCLRMCDIELPGRPSPATSFSGPRGIASRALDPSDPTRPAPPTHVHQPPVVSTPQERALVHAPGLPQADSDSQGHRGSTSQALNPNNPARPAPPTHVHQPPVVSTPQERALVHAPGLPQADSDSQGHRGSTSQALNLNNPAHPAPPTNVLQPPVVSTPQERALIHPPGLPQTDSDSQSHSTHPVQHTYHPHPYTPPATGPQQPDLSQLCNPLQYNSVPPYQYPHSYAHVSAGSSYTRTGGGYPATTVSHLDPSAVHSSLTSQGSTQFPRTIAAAPAYMTPMPVSAQQLVSQNTALAPNPASSSTAGYVDAFGPPFYQLGGAPSASGPTRTFRDPTVRNDPLSGRGRRRAESEWDVQGTSSSGW